MKLSELTQKELDELLKELKILKRLSQKQERIIFTQREQLRFLSESLDISEKERLRDELTGLHNYAHLKKKFEELKKWISGYRKKCEEEGKCLSPQYLCFAFIDLNDFKAINDTFGHSVGDQVLIFFSNTLASKARRSDVVVRKCGDEFIVLIPFQKRKDRDIALCRLENSLKNIIFDNGEVCIRLCAAVGYHNSLLHEDLELEACIDAADSEMYKNKARKR